MHSCQRVHSNDYSKRARDNLALAERWAWVGLHRVSCWNGVKLQWLTQLVCSSSSSSSSLCVAPLPATHVPTFPRIHRPSDLPFHADSGCWSIDMWHTSQPQSFIVKIQPEIVNLYMSIYRTKLKPNNFLVSNNVDVLWQRDTSWWCGSASRLNCFSDFLHWLLSCFRCYVSQLSLDSISCNIWK